MSGTFYSTSIAFGSSILTPPFSSADPLFIVKYDSSGTVLCADALASGGDDQSSVSADRFGNAYVGGDFEVSPFFVGSDTLLLANSSSENIFVAKWSCRIDDVVNEIKRDEAIEIFPDPSNGNFVVKNKNGKINSIEIYDATGNLILKTSGQKEQNEINLDNRPGGMYFVII